MTNKIGQQFKVVIEQGGDGFFVASVPALPGCYTQAKTLTELRKRVKEAIGLCLEVAKENPDYRKKILETASEPVFIRLETVKV